MALTKYFMAGGVAAIAGIYSHSVVGQSTLDQGGSGDFLSAPASKNPILGQKIFGLSGWDLKGKRVSLEQYLGNKPVVLNFFETWCNLCKVEMPSLLAFSRHYQGKATVVIATTDRNRDTIYYMTTNNYDSIPVILLDAPSDLARFVPTTYILDTAGKVVEMKQLKTDFMDRQSTIRKGLDNLLKKK